MAGIGKMRRRFVKGQFEKMGQGDLVSDEEKRAFQETAQQASEQAVGAQQQGLARFAQAQGTGSPIAAGAMAEGAQQLGQASAEAAAKASSQANKLAAAVREKRAASALAAGERLVQQNREDVGQAMEMGMRVAESGAQIFSSIYGMGM